MVTQKKTKVTHSCDTEFITSAKLMNFEDDMTEFVELSGNSAAAKAKRKAESNKAKGSKNTKLVDVTQLRAKYVMKIGQVAKMSVAHLNDVLEFYTKYSEHESELMDKFKRCLACKGKQTETFVLRVGSTARLLIWF